MWFKGIKISLFKHPAYSPNLAPIENVQSLLKNRLLKRQDTTVGIGSSIASINAFKKAILEEWDLRPWKDIDNCILSLPNCYKAVIQAIGWYTKH